MSTHFLIKHVRGYINTIEDKYNIGKLVAQGFPSTVM